MAESSDSSAEGDTASSTESVSSPKKVVSTQAMEPKAKSAHHPSTADMVVEAITKLEERGGSSLFAIKKYITETYKLDPEKQARFIKKYLKAAVESGTLIQTKGKGATGSFKIPAAMKKKAAKLKEAKLATAAAKDDEPPKKSTVKKAAKKTESTESTAPTKKQTFAKVAKKDSSATVKNAKTTKNATPKSPKAKKMAKSPTTKPKAPKPKKVTAGGKSPKAAAMSKKAVVAKK